MSSIEFLGLSTWVGLQGSGICHRFLGSGFACVFMVWVEALGAVRFQIAIALRVRAPMQAIETPAFLATLNE